MRVILVAVSLSVSSAGASGQADDLSPRAALAEVSDDASREAGGTGLGEKETGWLKLTRGTRVRLMVEDGGPMREVAGRLLSSDVSTVTIDTNRGPQSFSRDQLFHLQYRTGGRDRKKGAAIGAAITGLAGMVAGVVVLAKEGGNGEVCNGCTVVVGLFGIAGAVPGGAVGFAIGTTGGDWHRVRPDALAVTGAASPRRPTIGLQLRFGPH